MHFGVLLCTKSTYWVEMCNYYIVHCACFVQDLQDDDMRIPADEPAPHFKKPRFTRTETEMNSTYVNSHMSLREGDDLLQWACNEARTHSDVQYQSMRKLTEAIRMSYAPCGVKSKNFHEPLDGNQNVWLHYRDVFPTLKAMLKDPKFQGVHYVYTFHVQYSTSDRMYLQVFSTLHSKSFATTRGFASTGLSKVANGTNLHTRWHKLRAQGTRQCQFIH